MIYHYKKGTPSIAGGFGEGTKAEPWYWYGKTDGQTVNVNNSNADSSDNYRLYFRVMLKSGTAYNIGQTAPGGGDGRIRLYDSNFEMVADDDDGGRTIAGVGCSDAFSYTPSADGIYYIGAGAWGSSTGDFTVVIDPLPEQDTPPKVQWRYPTSTGFSKAGKAVGYRAASLAGCRLSRWIDDNTVLYLPMYGDEPFVDQSINAYTFNNNGVAFVSDIQPPSGGSGAAHFTAANQYLLSPSNMLAGLTEFTLEFDYMLDSIPTGNNWSTAFYFASNGANSSADGTDMRLEKDYITVQMNHDNGLVKSTYTPDTGIWHTLRISRNADSVVSISIDNELINSYTDTNVLYSSQSYGYVIGRSEPHGEAGTGFRGYMANYRISNVARLSAPKITVDTIPDMIWEAGTAITDVQISATVSDGGTPTFTANNLPDGIELSTSGLLSGTPTTAGTGSSTITVSYPGAKNATIQLNFTIEAKEEDVSGDYLTLTANTAGSSVSSKVTGTLELPGLKYRTDKNSGFVPYSVGQTIELPNAGDYVQFYNTEETFSKSYNTYFSFKLTGSVAASGNIQSLMGFAEEVPMAGYYQLFTGNSALTSAPEMPATKFGWASYGYMFYNCSNLSYIPCIPFDSWNADSSVTMEWVNGVASSGTIGYINDELPLEYGTSRIPEGWVEDNSYTPPGPDPDPDPVKKCPNRADCVKLACAQCFKTICTTHQTPVVCTDCEQTFCSEECKSTHTCTPVADLCSHEGCGNASVYTCEACSKKFCSEHTAQCPICGKKLCSDHYDFEDHSCIEAPEEQPCGIEGCPMFAGPSVCATCGLHICTDHAHMCEECNNEVFCQYCYDANHQHIKCEDCGQKDAVEVHGVCSKSLCSDCYFRHVDYGCEQDEAQHVHVKCVDCGKDICTEDECDTLELVGLECPLCNGYTCIGCSAEHNHDSGSKCYYDGCTEEANCNCVICGAAACGGHQFACVTCGNLGPFCIDHIDNHNCPAKHETVACAGCGALMCGDPDCDEHSAPNSCRHCGATNLCTDCLLNDGHDVGSCTNTTAKCVKCGGEADWKCDNSDCGATFCNTCCNNTEVGLWKDWPCIKCQNISFPIE